MGGVGLIVIDEGPYPAGEVQRVLQVPVVATLPFAPKEAKVLSDGAEQPRISPGRVDEGGPYGRCVAGAAGCGAQGALGTARVAGGEVAAHAR